MLLLTAGRTPQCLSAQSRTHVLGAKGSFLPLPPSAGPAPVTGAQDGTPTFSPIDVPAGATKHQLTHTPGHTHALSFGDKSIPGLS